MCPKFHSKNSRVFNSSNFYLHFKHLEFFFQPILTLTFSYSTVHTKALVMENHFHGENGGTMKESASSFLKLKVKRKLLLKYYNSLFMKNTAENIHSDASSMLITQLSFLPKLAQQIIPMILPGNSKLLRMK